MGIDELNLYSYTDYRRYLRDYYKVLKKRHPGRVSYRYLSMRGGFASSNFLYLVMRGQRNLSYGSVQRLAKGFGLTKRQTLFLESLVHFNQTDDVEDKERSFRKMLTFKEYRQAAQITPMQFDVFAKWYYPVIREMVNLRDFQEAPHWIAKRIHPNITPTEAQDALQRLMDLGLIVRDDDGNLRQVDAQLETGPEFRLAALKKFHHDMIGHGQRCLALPSAEREVSGLTLSLTDEQFAAIKKRVQELHHDIQDIIGRDVDGEADAICQLNFQLFPLTQRRGGRNG